MRKVRMLTAILASLLCVVIVLGMVINRFEQNIVVIDDEHTPLVSGATLVSQTEADLKIIPDKYNTGFKGNLSIVSSETTINGVLFRGGNGRIVLEFYNTNKSIDGDISFDNLDFSECILAFNNEDKVLGRKINITFNNCKFSTVKNGFAKSDVFSYTFNNCSFEQFQGSNATFNKCQFGHTYKDCMNPFQNVTAKDCYFLDLASTDPASVGKHSDGVQMFGHKDFPVENIVFDGCRFEIPAIQTTGDTASINSCLYVGLEYNNATNVHIRNCVVNGGGYTLQGIKKFDNLVLTDILYENIVVGGAKLFGTIYPKISEGVSFTNIVDQDSLYVSSVWKDVQGVHIIVSNDTCTERTLKVLLDNEVYTYDIPACLGGKELRYNHFDISFDSFPFDKEIIIPGDARYIICYDNSSKTQKQIRFVNWTSEQIYLGPDGLESDTHDDSSNSIKGTIVFEDSNIVFDSSLDTISDADEGEIEKEVENKSGKCGKNVEYVLLEDGVLYISGSGSMNNYNSSKAAPWTEYMDKIKKVVVDTGVTSIGAQSFRKATNLKCISISYSVENIGNNAFNGCTNLSDIVLEKTITSIGSYAFSGTGLSDAKYMGSSTEWELVNVGDHNEQLLNNLSFDTVDYMEENDSAILEGKCGNEVTFALNKEGVLVISGMGVMSNYNSSKVAPWNEYIDQIHTVIIEDGVTAIGNQSFRKAINLTTVEMAPSISCIGSNSFSGCVGLSDIVIGSNVIEIGASAFSGSGLSSVLYDGSMEEFGTIVLGDHNEKILDNLVFSY